MLANKNDLLPCQLRIITKIMEDLFTCNKKFISYIIIHSDIICVMRVHIHMLILEYFYSSTLDLGVRWTNTGIFFWTRKKLDIQL